MAPPQSHQTTVQANDRVGPGDMNPQMILSLRETADTTKQVSAPPVPRLEKNVICSTQAAIYFQSVKGQIVNSGPREFREAIQS
jgi:hypothetical protein